MEDVKVTVTICVDDLKIRPWHRTDPIDEAGCPGPLDERARSGLFVIPVRTIAAVPEVGPQARHDKVAVTVAVAIDDERAGREPVRERQRGQRVGGASLTLEHAWGRLPNKGERPVENRILKPLDADDKVVEPVAVEVTSGRTPHREGAEKVEERVRSPATLLERAVSSLRHVGAHDVAGEGIEAVSVHKVEPPVGVDVNQRHRAIAIHA